MIKGLDHVTIIVKDLDGAVAQYRKLLGTGAVQRADPPPGAAPSPVRGWKPVVLSFGSTNIELITPTATTGPWAQRLAKNGDGVYLVALKVDNLRATVEELRGKGVRLVGDPGPGKGPINDLVLIHPSSAHGVMLLLTESRSPASTPDHGPRKKAHMIRGLDHVTIIVKDFEGAIAQYKKILGIHTVRRSPLTPNLGRKFANFEFGETAFEIITPTDDTGPWARRLAANGDCVYLIAVKVDNLRETVEELRGKGVRLVGDPGPGTGPIKDLVLIHPTAANGVMISLVEQ